MGRAFRGSVIAIYLFLLTLSMAASAGAATKDDANSVVIIFKDGHQQSFPLSQIDKIEFKTPSAATAKVPVDVPSRKHFVGKWTVGDNGGHTYFFTLEENGEARNTVESGGHGSWAYVGGEAHVTWDNGWHDIIRKVGMKYRKFAFAPGKSFDETPTNEGSAQKTNPEPI